MKSSEERLNQFSLNNEKKLEQIRETVENTVFRMQMLYVSYPITWVLTSAALYLMGVFEFRKFKREHNLA